MAPTPAILTIGNFDGVHLGHAALVRRARDEARLCRGGRVGAPHGGAQHHDTPSPRIVAYVFDPHPLTLLRPEAAPPRLSTFEQRTTWLTHLGCDEVIRLEPTRDLLSQSPEAFIEHLLTRHAITAIIEGPDFRFGQGRAGDIATLRRLGDRHGFDVHIVEPVTVSLTDQSIIPASSSLARWLIAHGRVEDAAIVLGRACEIVGTVTRGEARGRTLGFPTANILAPTLLPADGIYAGEAMIPDGQRFAAAISVGTKPTFGGTDRTLEAMLLSPSTDGRASWRPARIEHAYDWPITLDITAWLRDQLRFASVDRLIEQMHRDCGRVMELAGSRACLAEPVP